MLDEIRIDHNIIIDRPVDMLLKLEQKTGIENIDPNDIIEFVGAEKSTKFYFDQNMCGKDEQSRDIKYMWVDTGFTDKISNRPLFISLLAHSGYYTGHIVGTSLYLSETIADYYHNKKLVSENEIRFREKYARKIENRTVKNLIDKYKAKSELCNTDNRQEQVLFERNIKAYWQSDPCEVSKNISDLLMFNSWKTINGLDRYIKIVGARISQLVEQARSEYYKLNHIKSAVVNTGLLDNFGSDIYVIYKYNLTYKLYTPHKVVESKKDYIYDGFISDKSESLTLMPITFFNPEDLPFQATMEDFDITPRALTHIINERRDRFPENVQNLSEAALAAKVKNALELGLKMQFRDYTYAKPSYSSQTRSISWMLPLHINNDFTEDPELILVIRKAGEFYEIKTILPYDDETKDKMTCLSIYNRLW